MGQFAATQENITGAQPSGQSTLFPGTDNKWKHLDPTNLLAILTPMGWRDNNVVVNGEFDYAQRQAPGTLTAYTNTTTRTYGADKFWVVNESNGSQYQRIDTSGAPETGLAPRFYGKYKKITALGKMMIGQFIEAANMAHLRGRTVRFQAKMKFSIAASMTVRLGIAQLNSAGTVDTFPSPVVTAINGVGTDPTLGANMSYITPNAAPVGDGGTINGSGLDCVLTAAWVRYSVTFTIPSNCKNLAVMIWTNGQPAINDELNISEVGLYEGQEIRDWFPRPQNEQLAQCQRYCWKTFNVDVAPVQNSGTLLGAAKGILGKAVATALAAQLHVRFPVSMRVAPAITLYNPSAANAQMRQSSGTVADLSATATANISEQSLDITATGAAGGAVGDQVAIHILADADL